MNFSRLTRAEDYEVEKWLKENMSLTDYEYRKMVDNEVVRFSSFYFYKKEVEKSSKLWRLTLPIYGVYVLLAICYYPINFMATGKWGYSRNFIDNFHNEWVRKLGL